MRERKKERWRVRWREKEIVREREGGGLARRRGDEIAGDGPDRRSVLSRERVCERETVRKREYERERERDSEGERVVE